MNFKVSVDARKYAPKDKHRTILEAYHSLAAGEAMELINDHDPKPLYYQFKAEENDKFTWEYLEEGPEVWKVAIGKK